MTCFSSTSVKALHPDTLGSLPSTVVVVSRYLIWMYQDFKPNKQTNLTHCVTELSLQLEDRLLPQE